MEPGDFKGRIANYHWEATSHWPEEPDASGSPNVLITLLDDVGFAQLGCFGSSIETPNMDRLAANGLRYSNFHTTALCSPTRAAVLTGRNHHTASMGRIADLAIGFPGYWGRVPRSCGFLSEILLEKGYATWAVGKWHLTPEEDTHMAASRRSWPLGRGFESFYGFHGGETHQFAPWLVHDNHFVDQPHSIEDGYHLTEDLVDHAIRNVRDLRSVDAAKPFFLYFTPGACHSPHHAPTRWLEHYRGRFDHGWDIERTRVIERQVALGVVASHTELSPRPEWVPAWEDLPEPEQRLYARYMEAFAAYLSHTDEQFGRLLDALKDTGDLENTLVMLLSDNGASSEGGPTGSVNDARPWNVVGRPLDEALERIEEIGGPRQHNNYPWGWTVAGNTPFRRWKREVHEGGVADPLVVSFPAVIAEPGGVRNQYVHAVDLAPTVLDLLGIESPEELNGVAQQPVAGASIAESLTDAGAADPRTTQYYEMFGCQAIRHGNWKAVTFHPIHVTEPGLDQVPWELYDISADPSECHDLAESNPEKLTELIQLWWAEAAKYQVLPLDNRPFSEFTLERPHAPAASRTTVTYYPGGSMVPEEAVPPLFDREHRITAQVDIPAEGAEGVLLSLGNLLGGFSFFIQDGALVYVHNLVGREITRIESAANSVPSGARAVSMSYSPAGGGAGAVSLRVDDAVVGEGSITRFTPIRWNLVGAGLVCGADPFLAVCDDYEAPFTFTGNLDRVILEVAGDAPLDPKAAADVALARQ